MSLLTVQRWVARAGSRPLEAVDFASRSSAPRRTGRTADAVEALVLDTRRWLRDHGDLGDYGAAAIREQLLERGEPALAVPSVRTIGRILERRGALEGRPRIRHPAPPRGWYLPDVAARRSELDEVDAIDGLHLASGLELDVLTLVSLHGGLPAAWPGPPLTTTPVIEALVEHWRTFGLPGYAQFDNAMVFAGSHARPDLGRVGRLCLGLGVVPVFVPPRELGFQASIESFNGHWQAKVWVRGKAWHTDLPTIVHRSGAYIAAYRRRSAARIEAAPIRRAISDDWDAAAWRRPGGRVVFIRRSDESGAVRFLRQRFLVDQHRPNRLVRAEVDLDAGRIRFYALRRRDPGHQPVLREIMFRPPWPRHP